VLNRTGKHWFPKTETAKLLKFCWENHFFAGRSFFGSCGPEILSPEIFKGKKLETGLTVRIFFKLAKVAYGLNCCN
jgi:hypothetical protein